MLKKIFLVFVLLMSYKAYSKDSTRKILTQFGLTAITFNKGEGLKLGALTTSIRYIHFDKYAFDFEYYNFNYVYAYEKNYNNIYLKDGNTYGHPRQVEMKVFKAGFGVVKKIYKINLIPYINFQYRYSNFGHQFYWFSDDLDHVLTTANSPFNSFGLGVGSSMNVLFFKRLNISTDFSFNKFFDKGKIYAPKYYGSLEKKDITSAWKDYKPLNNVINLQLKIGYLFNLK